MPAASIKKQNLSIEKVSEDENVVIISASVVEDYQALNAKCDKILEKISKRKNTLTK